MYMPYEYFSALLIVPAHRRFPGHFDPALTSLKSMENKERLFSVKNNNVRGTLAHSKSTILDLEMLKVVFLAQSGTRCFN